MIIFIWVYIKAVFDATDISRAVGAAWTKIKLHLRF